jgi:hypothetical protein
MDVSLQIEMSVRGMVVKDPRAITKNQKVVIATLAMAGWPKPGPTKMVVDFCFRQFEINSQLFITKKYIKFRQELGGLKYPGPVASRQVDAEIEQKEEHNSTYIIFQRSKHYFNISTSLISLLCVYNNDSVINGAVGIDIIILKNFNSSSPTIFYENFSENNCNYPLGGLVAIVLFEMLSCTRVSKHAWRRTSLASRECTKHGVDALACSRYGSCSGAWSARI